MIKKTGAPGGFTLIEIIIVVLVMGVIASVLAVVIVGGVNAFNSVYTREALMSEAESALETMSREIRNARRHEDIMQAESAVFSFTDAYGDGIRYSASPGGLERNDVLMAASLKSLDFSYLDSGLEAIESPVEPERCKDIRYVGIRIVLGKRGREVAVETRVRPRNF